MNAHDPRILIHEDIKALAKQAYELAQLPEPERAARKWDAVAVCGQIVGAATPAGLTAAQAALEARWGSQIRAQGLAALVDPWWYLRADDGQPPVIAGLIESAMTNPNRPLGSVLRSFAAVEPDKREALTDQVRAFLGRAFAGALGEARLRYVDVMRSRPEFNWPRDPWAAVLPYVQNDPPAQILVDSQGEDHDGGMFDDPDDDTVWEKMKFGVKEAAWAWGPALLQYNPPALFYQGVAGAAEAGAEAVRKPLEEVARFGKYLITGAAVTGAAALLLFVHHRSKAPMRERPEDLGPVIEVDAVEVP
jgi:hypothetical protein